jgi:hypothetical protein
MHDGLLFYLRSQRLRRGRARMSRQPPERGLESV